MVVIGLMSAPNFSMAGRPLNVNDIEPVETGKWQVEAGGAYRHDSGCDHFDCPLTLAYGVLPGLDLGVGLGGQFEERAETHGKTCSETGVGDLTICPRWKYLEQSSFLPGQAVSFTVKIPTADHYKGLGSGATDFDLTWIASEKIGEKLQIDANAGYSWIGKPKLESAAARLREVNPHVRLELYAARFTPDNALEIARNYDLLVDGSDNFPTRFLSNDTAFFLRKPLVYGAIHRFEGQTGVFAPHLAGPCYRCLLPALPAPGSVPSCQEAGVLGVLPGIIGSIQAMETLKLILGIGTVPLGRLTVYDALQSTFRSFKLSRDPQCRLCGDSPDIHSVSNTETTAPATCDISSEPMQSITTQELRSLLAGDFTGLLIDVREPDEHTIARIDGSRLIPLKTLPDQLDHLPRDREIYVHCKTGMRSSKAVRMLMDRGFTRVHNVTGGIDAWLADRP